MASQQKILHIAGWSTCGFYKRAAGVLSSLSLLFPSKLEIIEHQFPSRDEYRSWLIDSGFRSKIPNLRAHKHTSSPFVWTTATKQDETPLEFIGGCDDTLAFCREFCSPVAEDKSAVTATMVDDGYDVNHPFDYDLVVIGGGSGGLAASKEAVAAGATKVAVLDFVKPSPQGSTWGLGGTCVNVGCIPKKLMHNAALIGETLRYDTKSFGFDTSATGTSNKQGHNWELMRQNVQNHIKGLNFKYRVTLREQDVTYLNKLGRFKDKHTLEVTDKKGNTSEITAARFMIAVGGRPTGLDCEGGELAITSDDVFSLESSPGKTLCVGASYISLECAGFLAGLGLDVTVAVRSILLRGFDRECADMIGTYMEDHGVKFRREVVPTKLEKLSDGKIQVTFSDGQQDVYDTVLVAIGRTADTKSLGLENVGVTSNPKNAKIFTKFEQTECPNIYAVGDVMEGCPELTPVAIQAGKLLSRRLFGGSKEAMDYKNVCTTVFTPLEYGAVGYSEEDAIQTFGEDSIDVYHKLFTPLEWSLSDARSHHKCFTKVIVNRKENDKVIGIHFVGPSAGEVLQGYGVAIKKGVSFKELQDTVGIHPTSSEEIVTLTVTKRSGEKADAGNC